MTRWPRWWGPHSQLCTIPVGAIEKTTQRALFDAVDAVGFDTEAALALLVAAIRRAASVRAPALIGSECMAIELPPPIGERNPRILYLEPVGPPAERFTPWLVSEHGMFAPSQVTGGGWAFNTGGFTFDVVSLTDPATPTLPAEVHSQCRRPPA